MNNNEICGANETLLRAVEALFAKVRNCIGSPATMINGAAAIDSQHGGRRVFGKHTERPNISQQLAR